MLDAEGSSPRSGAHCSVLCKSVSGGQDRMLKICQKAEESTLEG